MHDSDDKTSKPGNKNSRRRLAPWIQTWFKILTVVLIALILARIFKLQVFVEIEFDGEPITTALTSIETYYLPLGLVLLLFILAWAWHRFFGSDKS